MWVLSAHITINLIVISMLQTVIENYSMNKFQLVPWQPPYGDEVEEFEFGILMCDGGDEVVKVL